MKNVILSTLITVLSVLPATAQFYVGGSLGVNAESEAVEGLDNSRNPAYSFSVSPEIGYSLNEKLDIGMTLNVLFSSGKQANIGFEEGSQSVVGIREDKAKNFEIAPYIRYSLLKWGKFSVLGMISAYANTGKTEYKSVFEYGNGLHYSESQSEAETISWGVRIRPVLKYSFSDKFTLLAYPNLFRLGFHQNRHTTNYNLEGDKYTTISTGLDCRIETSNLIPSIGIIYKF